MKTGFTGTTGSLRSGGASPIRSLAGLRKLVVSDLRLRNPWNYKAPLLVSFPYFMIGAAEVPLSRGLLGILASCCTIAGIAGLAYFINDAADSEKDRLAGRANAWAPLGRLQKCLLVIPFLAAALLPWLYLPLRWENGTLLLLEFVLFALYAFPPFRLKERGSLGLFTDALYAHANPAVAAVLTFSFMGGRAYGDLTVFLAALGLWQFSAGVRNIVLHQLKDFDGDTKSGTRTLAVKWGKHRMTAALKRVFVPMEVLGFGVFAVVVSREMIFFIPVYAVYVALTVIKIRYVWKQPLPSDTREILYKYLDDFYIEWIPLVVLAYLLTQNAGFWPLLAVHVLLFRSAVRQWLGEIKWISWSRTSAALAGRARGGE